MTEQGQLVETIATAIVGWQGGGLVADERSLARAIARALTPASAAQLMTDLDLAAIRAREQAATPGPWVAATARNKVGVVGVHGPDRVPGTGHAIAVFAAVGAPQRVADTEFAAHARTDIPALLDEVERLRALLGKDPDAA